MRKVLPVILACCIGIGGSNAAVRDATTISRNAVKPAASVNRASRQNNVVSRATTQSVKVRATDAQTTRSNTRNTISRTATPATSRTATSRVATTSGRTARAATTKTETKVSRAATNTNQTNSKTFGTGYNTCRDAYFTCMDQFCAAQDETYRRCVCSSRLNEIKTKQRALAQSADQLQDFKDLNIEAIPKTAAEVQAMQKASEGEMVSSFMKDKSSSIAQLAGISAVLSNTKSKSLSTAGQLDIAGDINAIWATTDLTSGLNISNLNGEILYSAVHSQCINLVADHCSSKSLLNMVVSAYSMYIENDCSLLANSLDKKKLDANASIRETEREMNSARLKNYDAHNASSINECIAMVRKDVTADSACGSNYIHCLDTTGLYLNKTTGEPIYTSNFYQLGSLLSLSGDVLTNQTNRTFVAELNRKRMFAEKSLDTCRDLANEVWDEFMRQAITEIYQGQQTRIRNVRNECLDVVNQCYDTQSNSLKDFSNIKEQLLLGARLELSEELCREKLDACSNLYGGGEAGLAELLTTMTDITTQKIAQNCFETLQDYAKQLCAVPSSDTLHSYPYACRAYAPGDQQSASWWECNKETLTQTPDDNSETTSYTPTQQQGGYSCEKIYVSCSRGYYMLSANDEIIFEPENNPELLTPGNKCVRCHIAGCPTPKEDIDGDESDKIEYDYVQKCSEDYPGSLYQQLVKYAVQACLRPTAINALNDNSELPNTLLQDVNATMDLIKASMASSLKTECERIGGYWVAAQWNNAQEDIKLFDQFYNETGANKKWGYCADKESIEQYYTGTTEEETEPTNNGPESDGGSGAGNPPDAENP